MNKVVNMKIIRVNKTEFETEDGKIIPHFFELDNIPSVEEFQKMIEEAYKKLFPELDDEKSS